MEWASLPVSPDERGTGAALAAQPSVAAVAQWPSPTGATQRVSKCLSAAATRVMAPGLPLGSCRKTAPGRGSCMATIGTCSMEVTLTDQRVKPLLGPGWEASPQRAQRFPSPSQWFQPEDVLHLKQAFRFVGEYKDPRLMAKAASRPRPPSRTAVPTTSAPGRTLTRTA